VHQVANSAHIHQDLVGALVSERAAKLCNHSWVTCRDYGGARQRVNAAAGNYFACRSTSSITPMTAASMGELGRRQRSSRKSFGGEQDAFADSRVHGVQRKHGIAAVGAVQIERLDDENLAALVRG